MCCAQLLVGMVASALSLWQMAEDRSAYLLLYSTVQQELNLDGDQRERIKEIFSSVESKPKNERAAFLGEQLDALLKNPQSQRLKEIHAQVLVTRGVLPAKVIDALKLNEDQRQRLDDAIKKNEAANRELKRLLTAGNYRTKEALEAVKKKYYEPARERLRESLTTGQWEAVQRQLGKEFPGALEMSQDF